MLGEMNSATMAENCILMNLMFARMPARFL
jgi:hypothetical protein